ncbi:MAG: class I mannose-6-phosphate isomerase [Bacteroidales bacterium]|nr:class I mannose-6-phosphate isomerase [Bacteroidales bacterium]
MYKFKPILKTLVWGTENWVLSGVHGNESVVAEGPEAGRTLNDIYGGEFPLLIKFIDAHDDLSIQVHPDDELAKARHGCNGKTEMWYVIGSDNGHLLSGFSKEITKEEYKAKVDDGTITDALSRYEIAEGDVFFLPAGRIHAIGGGSHIAEIQQTSDITYRIYDYKRPGLDGKPRELHTELAVDAIDWSVRQDYRTHYEHKQNAGIEIVKCPYFTTDLYDLTEEVKVSLSENSPFLVVICFEGEGSVNGTNIKAGEAALIMKDEAEAIFSPSGTMKLLTSRIE